MATELLVLFKLMMISLAYFFGASVTPEQQQLDAQMAREAWQTLLPCSETFSFDGRWKLSLSKDGKAELYDRREEQKLQSRWELIDAQEHAYRIEVLAFGNDFVVVPSSEGCMLASGSLRRADLSQSWFARSRPLGGNQTASISDAQRQ